MHRFHLVPFAMVVALAVSLAEAVPAHSGNKPEASDQATHPEVMVPWALRPDLRVDKFWIAKDDPKDPHVQNPVPLKTNPRVGQKIWFICDGTNIGADIHGLWLVGFYVDGVMKWNASWGDLPSGQSKHSLGPYTCEKEGSHQVECVQDANNVLNDRDPSNNRRSMTLTILPKLTAGKPPIRELPRRVPAPNTSQTKP